MTNASRQSARRIPGGDQNTAARNRARFQELTCGNRSRMLAKTANTLTIVGSMFQVARMLPVETPIHRAGALDSH